MTNFQYVKKSMYSNTKKDLEMLIHHIQNEVRDQFTFSYNFVGSVKRNMVTMDFDSNIGFDFDVNIHVNDDYEDFSPKEIKSILKQAFDKFNNQFGYDYCEDSTRVLTIKVKDKKNSRILHSADFAIVYDCNNNQQQYIHFNKKVNRYTWEYQPKSNFNLEKRISLIKKNHLWEQVRELYLYKKNNNFMHKKSRSLFSETINEVFQQYF